MEMRRCAGNLAVAPPSTLGRRKSRRPPQESPRRHLEETLVGFSVGVSLRHPRIRDEIPYWPTRFRSVPDARRRDDLGGSLACCLVQALHVRAIDELAVIDDGLPVDQHNA